MNQNYKMIAKTFYGLETVLANELRALGAQHVEQGIRNVSFYGDKGFMYKANLWLRTALKILKPIASFRIKSENHLYRHIKKIEWDAILTLNDTFAIDSVVHSDHFGHSKYVALKSKDAIADFFRNKYGARPDVDTAFPTLRIHVHIQKDIGTVLLDSSGNSLHQRGYRSATNAAPINEVLAAAMLLLSGWKGDSHFLDPMCGSGTILIEAAKIACNIPANINRKEFAFEKWADYDEALFDRIYNAALEKAVEPKYHVTGYDIDPSMIKKAKRNIENAHLKEFIKVHPKDFFETEKTEVPLLILFNPPYGKRLETDTSVFYKRIGDALKQQYTDTTAWFITSDLQGLKHVGLRPSKKIQLYNGKLECRFVRYDMYHGSKKKRAIEKETSASSVLKT